MALAVSLATIAGAQAPAQAALITACSARTPMLSNSGWPYQTIESCHSVFEIPSSPGAVVVTARLSTDPFFVGRIGLRVRGSNALWTEFYGVFAHGERIQGQEQASFVLSPGTWVLEVFTAGPAAGPINSAHTVVGTYRGTIET